jgi:ubiquinone/menaquinone biosynthesis C-methylase UbiE
VLCTVNDPTRALQEAHRVLKPGGQLLFLEHVRSDDAKLARWQDRLNGLQTRVGHSCNCKRPTLETIKDHGFSITKIEHENGRGWVRTSDLPRVNLARRAPPAATCN